MQYNLHKKFLYHQNYWGASAPLVPRKLRPCVDNTFELKELENEVEAAKSRHLLLILLLKTIQIRTFAFHRNFSTAHIHCQPRWQPRNYCKMIVLAAQNSSSATILYLTLYSQPRTHCSMVA